MTVKNMKFPFEVKFAHHTVKVNDYRDLIRQDTQTQVFYYRQILKQLNSKYEIDDIEMAIFTLNKVDRKAGYFKKFLGEHKKHVYTNSSLFHFFDKVQEVISAH